MRFPQREEGQGLVEYALLLVLVAIVVIAILVVLGDQVQIVFTRITYYLQGGSITPGLDYKINVLSANCQQSQNTARIEVDFEVEVIEANTGQPADGEKVIALVIASRGSKTFDSSTANRRPAVFNNKAVLVTACSDSVRIIAGDDMVSVP